MSHLVGAFQQRFSIYPSRSEEVENFEGFVVFNLLSKVANIKYTNAMRLLKRVTVEFPKISTVIGRWNRERAK